MTRLGIELLDGDVPVREHALERPLRFGRALDSDVVFAHPDVSAHHAVVSRAGDEVVLLDLRSTNGTTVNGQPVTRARPLADGDLVGFGDAAFVVVRLERGPAEGGRLFVEDLASGLVHPVVGDRLALGGLSLTFRDQDGAVALEGPDGPVPLGPDGFVEVAGRALRVRRPTAAETTRRASGPARYAVEARLSPAPAATFVDRGTGRAHTMVAETRALLVFLLARQWEQDRAAGRAEVGWCDDDRVRSGIWGGPGRSQLGNNLNVVVSRTRRELVDHGFDALCIERQRGRTRLVVDAVELDGPISRP